MHALAVGLLLFLQAETAPRPWAIVSRATAAVEAGQDTLLRAEWQAALARHPGDRVLHLGLGTLDRLTYHYPEALAHLERARSSSPDPVDYYARAGEAEIEGVHGSLRRAAARYDSLLMPGRWQLSASEPGAMDARTARGIVAWRLDGPAAGLAFLDRPEPPGVDPAVRARLGCARAIVSQYSGDDRAEGLVRAALRQAERSGAPRVVGYCLQVLGAVLINRENNDRPFALFDSAAALQARARDWIGWAETVRWRGWSALVRSRYAEAYGDLSRARDRGLAVGYTAAWTYRHLAALHRRYGDQAAALRDVAIAESLASRSDDPWALTAARTVRADLAMDRGDLAAAEATFRQNLEWSLQSGQRIEVYTALYGLLYAAIRRGNWTEADRLLRDMERYLAAQGLAGWVPRVAYESALIALGQGDLRRAERKLRIFQVQAGPSRLERYAARSRLAVVYLARGEVARAESELTTASDELDAYRASLDQAGLRLAAFQTHRVYDDPDAGLATAAAGLASAGREEAAFLLVERRRARHLSEAMLRAGGATGVAARDPGLVSRLRSLLDSSTAVLEYVTGPGGQPTTLFVLWRSGLKAIPVPPADSLAADIASFRRLVAAGSAPSTLARRLGDALLTPALAALPPHVLTLILVPDGLLHRVPFDALGVPEGVSLAEAHAVSRAPSATTLVHLLERRPAQARGLLAMGGPAMSLSSALPGSEGEMLQRAFREAGGLGPLPRSASEAREVAGFSRSADLRTGGRASEAFFKAAHLVDYAVIHIATHALVDDRVEGRTALALAEGEGEDGFLGTADLAQLKLDADLVVLSSCRTAGGMVLGGEGVQGLSTPLLGAGARAVVASLWPVSDQATESFMVRFYAGMARGKPAGEALREAKLWALRAGRPASEWAAFTLIGDPMVRPPLRTAPWGWWWVVGLVVGTSAAWALRQLGGRRPGAV